jgi:hypothetical protein
LSAGLVALVVAALFHGAALADELDQRVPARPGGRLQVDLDFGEETRWERVSLEVRSHDADEVWAVADVSGLGSSTVRFRLEHDPRVVRLYGRAGGILSWLFGGPSVSVRVWVPREFSVDLRCTSGPIRVEEVTGELRARTRDAPIEVRGAEGRLDLHTRGGAIQVTEVLGDVTARAAAGALDLSWIKGAVDARTGQGDVDVSHVAGGMWLRTDSGEIRIREAQGPAHARTEWGAVYATFAGEPSGDLETQRGSIEVALPGHSRVALDVRSPRGTVEVDPGLEARGKREATRFAGDLNGGGAGLRIYTARGTVRVNRR